MKKLLFAFLSFMLLSPAFAQFAPVTGPFPGLDVLFREYAKKYSKLIQNKQDENGVNISTTTIKGEYYTEEQTAIDNAILELTEYGKVILPKEEKQVTNSYNEITVMIPEGYTINKYIDPANAEEKLVFLQERSILIYNNKKETTFKLDYDIDFENEEKVLGDEGYLYDALTLKIRYSPKYFSFKRVFSDYNPAKTVQVEYNGKPVTLNVEVFPVLTITTPKGSDMQYVLEPNFQSIYNDFEFVRKGHKQAVIE